MATDPDEARRKFEGSFFCSNLDPGDINIKPTTTSTATTTTEEDVWDDELKEAGKKKVEIKMQESADDLQIDCWTIFDLYNPEKITGT